MTKRPTKHTKIYEKIVVLPYGVFTVVRHDTEVKRDLYKYEKETYEKDLMTLFKLKSMSPVYEKTRIDGM